MCCKTNHNIAIMLNQNVRCHVRSQFPKLNTARTLGWWNNPHPHAVPFKWIFNNFNQFNIWEMFL